MKLAISMWSGPIVYSAPWSESVALDAQDVRLDAVDVRAERVEEAAEILDVRLAGSVAEHGLALCERCTHHGVLRAGDARLVEEDARSRSDAWRSS